jgi:branched-subunit amino acid transport protein AzlD
MRREHFNSPEKRWVRERLWLPKLRAFRAHTTEDLKYLTFAGPEGHDIELFCVRRKLIQLERVHVWEKFPSVAGSLRDKYGPMLDIKQGEASDLVKAKDERRRFPFHVINLDYTEGAFNMQQTRWTPIKVETLENVVAIQRECASSFLLFLAVAAAADVDTEIGRSFVQKMAFDVATRLGRTEPLFILTRNLSRQYAAVLADVLPCAVIRIAGEKCFDASCIGKAVYRPFGSRRTTILSLAFSFEYANPPVSQTFHQIITVMDRTIETRQRDSFSVPLVDVNERIRRRRER